MGITIVEPGPDIKLTRQEHERLQKVYEWNRRYTTSGESFETFVRRQIENGNVEKPND